MTDETLRFGYPDWVSAEVDWRQPLPTTTDRMRLVIDLSRHNVEHRTGGPFGAIVVERESGRLVSVGVNSVVRFHDCTLHGEMVAISMAGRRLRSFTLSGPGMPEHELVTSCEPCAMCLGAILWSGVKHVVTGAAREDATRLRFEEGPVFPESYRYLAERGVTFERNVLRDEARAVLESYRAGGGLIYNA